MLDCSDKACFQSYLIWRCIMHSEKEVVAVEPVVVNATQRVLGRLVGKEISAQELALVSGGEGDQAATRNTLVVFGRDQAV
jgi:hypothetical protein